MRQLCSRAALALALFLAPHAAHHARAADPAASESFVQRSLKAGRIQAALARLASLRSENAAVKSFAEALARDLDVRNARLARLAPAETAGAADPLAERATIFASTQDLPLRTREFHRLGARKGPALDKQFLRGVIVGHENAIRGYEAEAKSDNAEVRRYAADTLPRLNAELAEARRLLDEIEEQRR